jgi:hypothetical protein
MDRRSGGEIKEAVGTSKTCPIDEEVIQTIEKEQEDV